MQTTTRRSGFFRHFLGGFAIGAVALVGVQLAHNVDAPQQVAVQQGAVVTPIG